MVNSHANTLVLVSMARTPNTQVSPSKGRRMTVALKVDLIIGSVNINLNNYVKYMLAHNNFLFVQWCDLLSKKRQIVGTECNTHCVFPRIFKGKCKTEHGLELCRATLCTTKSLSPIKFKNLINVATAPYLASIKILAVVFESLVLKRNCWLFQSLCTAQHRNITFTWKSAKLPFT